MYCEVHKKYTNTTYCDECNSVIYSYKSLAFEAYVPKVEDLVTAKRSDTGKNRLDLLAPVALEGTAAILAFGAKKYEANNWRKGMAWSRCIASLLRHLMAFIGGEDLDPESGLPHIDHVACNAMFLQQYFRTNKELDDRYKNDKT